MQKIGIYGGTFDPVHQAHLILGREALECFVLDKLIFVPAAVSPHKNAPLATAEMRLRMLQTVITEEPSFELDDCELRRPPPSYTVDTVESMRDKNPGAQLFLLLGDDLVPNLPSWHRFDDLRRLVTFVVLRRAERAVRHEYLNVTRRIDISATEIRTRVAAGKSIRYLVPESVEKLIRAQHLYREGELSIPRH